MTKKDEIDAIGQWVVLDVTENGTSLLSVGQQDFEGVSPRNRLDARTRTVLLQLLREAVTTGTAFEQTVTNGAHEYAVRALPKFSPDQRQVIGAYGVFDVVGKPLPEPPVLGAWQWRVDPKTGKNIGDDASLWDENLHELYGYRPADVESGRGVVGDWLAKLISTKDREAIKLVIDSGITVNNRSRHLLTYEAIYGYGTATPTKQQITNSARAFDDPDYPEAIMLRGFSRRVAAPTKFVLPGLSPIHPGLVTEALFQLTSDRAFAALDLSQEVTFRTSPKWAEYGLSENFEGNIAALAHPDDKGAFESQLVSAAAGGSDPVDRATVRLRTTNNTWKPFLISLAPIDRPTPNEPSRYLMAGLAPVSSEDQ